jgi:hypothetical protein
MTTITLPARSESHRQRFARDALRQFADADEFFDKGIDTLAGWLSENISDSDLGDLSESIRMILHERVQEQVTGAVDSGRRSPRPTVEAEFNRMFPDAMRIKY